MAQTQAHGRDNPGARSGAWDCPIGIGQNTHLRFFADSATVLADCSFTVLGTEEPAVPGVTQKVAGCVVHI